MRRTANFSMRIALLAATLAAGCGSPPPAAAPPVPAGWQTITTAWFVFRAPPDVQSVPVQGVDSIVGKYASPALQIGFDLGQYADPLTGEGYASRRLTVDGRPARLATKADWSAIHFPGGDGKAKLTMGVRFAGADAKVAETILRSIDFP